MKRAFLNLLILCAQRVPFLRDIPAIRDSGTIHGAISVLSKVADKLSAIATVRATEATRAAQVATKALESEERALAEKARAEELAETFAKLTA